MVSMTGFASVSREDERAVVSVTARSVNHRFLDVQVRLPAGLGGLESGIRALVQKRASRGRVDVLVNVQQKGFSPVQVEVNLPAVEALASALKAARATGQVEGALTPGDLLRIPQAVVFREADPAAGGPDADLQALVEATVDAAIGQLNVMRSREGEMLRRDLDARRDGLAGVIEDLARAANEGRVATEARLATRVRELAFEVPVEPALIAQEVVRFVSRSDISEEVVRFRAHLDHWAHLTAAEEPCGRKLDFLLQEMNREINTIGSKAEGTRVPELVVHAKAELERMREQVQNVE
jgi:uncharacterized protein (TIGR00255 family)